MSSYRFYSHDHLGRLVDRREQQCRNDADALAVGRDLNHTHDIEIWLGPHRVARVPKRMSGAEVRGGPADDADAAQSPVLDKVGNG
jgi:hypothetical protein